VDIPGLDLQTLLIRALPILWALTVHEFAHAWAAHKCGDDTALYAGRLTLNPLAHLDLMGTLCFFVAGFGWAKPVPVNPHNFRYPSRDDIIVSLAGIAANLISAVVFGLGFRLFVATIGYNTQLTATIALILSISVWFNLILAFFNLIPIPPLDGSHVLAELLPPRLLFRYNEIFGRHGPIILLALIFVPRLIFNATNGQVDVDIISWIIGRPTRLLALLLTGEAIL